MIKYFLNELSLLHAPSITNRPLHFMTHRRKELDIGHYSKPGLANFNPQEGHIILNGSPEGRTCVYIYQKVGDLIN